MKYINYRNLLVAAVTIFVNVLAANAMGNADTIVIHTVGHGSIYFEYKNLVIHVDPFSKQADYSTLPDADIILITHGHGDHYDLNAINDIKKKNTVLVCPQAIKDLGTHNDTILVMNNGDSISLSEIQIKAVPAYNIVSSTIYHPKGTGNGYILTLGKKRIYIAGDTELIPEMSNFGTIDIAFIPMNLPYTMPVDMAAEAVKIIHPKIAYIYHYGNSDTTLLRNLLNDQPMEIRIGPSVYKEIDK